MTADTDAPVEAGSPPLPVAQASAAVPAPRRATAWRVGAVIGVVVPSLVMVWVALRGLPTFDGGLNFQVAWNIAHGHGLIRNYGGVTVSPQELETSGAFLVVAALSLKIFGLTTFGLQLTNLLYLVVLLVFVSAALRPWPWLRVLGPTLILLLVPQVTQWGFGGYGEFTSAALTIGCFVLLGRLAEGARRPLVLCAAAFALLGAALTVKVVSIAAIPVAVVGLGLVLLVRADVSRWRMAATALGCAVVPVAAWELYRLTQLGSLDGWKGYWSVQLGRVSARANRQAASEGFLHKAADHVHLLGLATGIGAAQLLVFLALPVALVVVTFVVRNCSYREWLALPGRTLAVMLAGFSSLYLVWWIFLTPTAQAWLRRFMIGWIAIALLYLLLVAFAIDAIRKRPARDRAHRRARLVAVVAVGVAAVAVAGPIGHLTSANLKADVHATNALQRDEKLASSYAAGLASSGATLCGTDWWSAPVVSLTSGVPLCDLSRTNVCTAVWRSRFAAGTVYLVWDRYAIGIISKTPPKEASYTFAQAAKPSPYASFWHVALKPGRCK